MLKGSYFQQSEDIVSFFWHKCSMLLPVPKDPYFIPLGKAAIRNEEQMQRCCHNGDVAAAPAAAGN
jgi:hypothetical protein